MKKIFPLSCSLGLLAALAAAQPPPVQVRFSEAIEIDMRRTLELTGSVESRQSSVVAAAVGGLVASLPAREGERVRRGDALVRLDAGDIELRLAAARGELEEAEARLRLAEADFDRFEGLFADQVVSRQELDDAESELAAWRGRRSQLQAEVDRLERDLRLSVIRAPFAGAVVQEMVAVGEWLAVGQAAAELIDLSDLEVTVEVPERDVRRLSPGDAVGVTFEALPGVEVQGELRAVVPRADPQARSFPVKVTIPNEGDRIGVGMLARVALPVGEGRSTAVPKDAIVDRGSERVVFVMGEEGGVRSVSVETGAAKGVWAAVRGDLQAGDRVVVRGNERLRDGQAVDGTLLEYPLP